VEVDVYRNLTHPQNVLKKQEKINMNNDFVKRLRDLSYNQGHDLPDRAADRIEKLEAALKPFLQLPIGVEAKDPDEMEVYQCHGWSANPFAVVTVGDFRRARKALEGKDG
jgi:hypothetical protein